MKKVVIIGGGFVGSYIARKLEDIFEVILIDNKKYFEFTPSTLELVVSSKLKEKIRIFHKDYLKKSKIIIDKVQAVEKSKVILSKGKKIEFDYLVICSGSSYNSNIKGENVFSAKNSDDLISSYEKLKYSKNILIIGGGLVGVELASEIYSKYPEKNITIIDLLNSILSRNNKDTIGYVEKDLSKNNVKIILNEKIIERKGRYFITDKNTKIKTDIAYLSIGVKPNSDFMNENFKESLDKKGQIIINQHLQLLNYTNIFSAGDVNSLSEEKTAQNAKRQAELVSYNIVALESNKKLKSYHEKKTPIIISLGKWNGIFETEKLSFGGIIPALLKYFVEIRELLPYKFRKWKNLKN